MAVMNGMEVGCITDVLRLVPICNTKSMSHCSGKAVGPAILFAGGQIAQLVHTSKAPVPEPQT